MSSMRQKQQLHYNISQLISTYKGGYFQSKEMEFLGQFFWTLNNKINSDHAWTHSTVGRPPSTLL